MPIQYSRSIPVSCTWHLSCLPHALTAVSIARIRFCRGSEIFVSSVWSVIPAHCHFDVALLPPWPVLYALSVTCTLFAPVLFSPHLFWFRFILVQEDFFLAELKWTDILRLAPVDPVLHRARWCERCLLITESPKTPGHFRYLIWVLCYIPYTGSIVLGSIVLAPFSQLDFSCPDRLSHITTVGFSCFPQKRKCPRRTYWPWKTGVADIAASPSIFVALLICCSARNTVHVGDLEPASSDSSVRLFPFWMVVISACSWPVQGWESSIPLVFQRVLSPITSPSSPWV